MRKWMASPPPRGAMATGLWGKARRLRGRREPRSEDRAKRQGVFDNTICSFGDGHPSHSRGQGADRDMQTAVTGLKRFQKSSNVGLVWNLPIYNVSTSLQFCGPTRVTRLQAQVPVNVQSTFLPVHKKHRGPLMLPEDLLRARHLP